MLHFRLDSNLLNYIVRADLRPGDYLPTLKELSRELHVNVGKLREQLEVARTLGLVEVRPRTGIRLKDYDFLPAMRLSVLFCMAMDHKRFQDITALRNHVEVAFWNEAASQLTAADRAALHTLVDSATEKLNHTEGDYILIPHEEHRKFHMGIFARLDNPFVQGILASYWEAYEAVELNTFAELQYWQEAWRYHRIILEHLDHRELDAAKEAFIVHTQLVRHNGMLSVSTANGTSAHRQSPSAR
jgi:DNA-binding FadR family transcriptional regulator